MAVPPTCDVVVVGAGLAGLTAAYRLRRAGLTVAVMEARDEPGGRALTRFVDGEPTDLGGEWVGRAHRRVVRLMRELDLQLEPAGNTGHPVLWRLPDREQLSARPPKTVWPGLLRGIANAAWLSRRMPAEAPWSAPRARELDTHSVVDWLDGLALHADARYVLERTLGSMACGALHAMSLLQLVWLLRIAGGPLRSLNAGFQSRVGGGAQQIARRLAGALGDRMHYRTPCERVDQDSDGVVVTGAGVQMRGRRAVVAVPVTQLNDIHFEPALELIHRELTRLRIQPGVKVVGILPVGHSVRHNTVVGGEVLWAGWRRGDRVTGFVPASADASDSALIADLADAFRVAASDLRATTVMRWADQPHIGGCDAVFAPGQVTGLGPHLRRPHGLVEFAGAERSSWPINMEGAVRSGERAAAATLAALRTNYTL